MTLRTLPLAPLVPASAPIGPIAQVADYRDARRILAVCLDAMGDLLMTTPALRAIRRGAPDAHLALLTSPTAAPVAALLPGIDATLVHRAPWVAAPPEEALVPREAATAIVDSLREGRFDAAVVFTVNSQSPLPAALTLLLAGVDRRAAHCRENPYGLLTEWLREPEPDVPLRHEVRRQLDLVAALGFPASDDHLSVRVPPDAVRRMRSLLASRDVSGARPWAVLHSGASAPSRRYPADRFATAGRLLAERHGWRIVLTGSEAERPVVEELRRIIGPSAVALAGQLTIADLAALLAQAPLLIAGNSGPVHLAAAVGTPVVDVYALTNPQHTPWGVPSRVLVNPVPCAGCRRSVCPEGHHACLMGIEPDAVVAAALELVSSPAISATA
jgi:lipopolysaccharide heptosyltransferase II